jgi:serine/threonine-protein kinase
MDSIDDEPLHDVGFDDATAGSPGAGHECGLGHPPLLTYHHSPGKPLGPSIAPPAPAEFYWNARYVIQKRAGQGAQGIVYQARLEGSDGYHLPVAIKMFHKHSTWSPEEYAAEMRRIATQANEISRIQQDNVVSIRDFVALDEMRIMILAWIDGLDLSRLLNPARMARLHRTTPRHVWERLNDVVVTTGEDHCRVRPGVAVNILQECLAGIASLHHHGIVHCDLKPSNIMVNTNGVAKIIDVDSSAMLDAGSETIRGTPHYMAPEQLRGERASAQSDLASLGYVLIELLTGRRLFKGCETLEDLLQKKLALPGQLEGSLAGVVSRDSILYQLVRKMIATDLHERFADADVADLDRVGSARFLRQLIEANLFAEYGRELAWWLQLPQCCAGAAAGSCPCPAPCPLSGKGWREK